MTTKRRAKKQPPRLPRIGPTRCPLHLWYLEFWDAQRAHVFRRYFADRAEARAALKLERQRIVAAASD